MEAVSFDDTLRMLGKVVGEDLNENRTIPVCSEEMYEVIADFGRGLGSDRTARVQDCGPEGKASSGTLTGGQRFPI